MLCVFLFKDLYWIYIVDSSTLNSWPKALQLISEWSLTNTRMSSSCCFYLHTHLHNLPASAWVPGTDGTTWDCLKKCCNVWYWKGKEYFVESSSCQWFWGFFFFSLIHSYYKWRTQTQKTWVTYLGSLS